MNLIGIIPLIASLVVGAYGMPETSYVPENKPVEKPAFMIIKVGWSSGSFGEIRDYPNISECEKVAEHISKVRTPQPSKSTEGIDGAWKFSFKRTTTRGGQEPIVSILCVPSSDEVDIVSKGLEEQGLYNSL